MWGMGGWGSNWPFAFFFLLFYFLFFLFYFLWVTVTFKTDYFWEPNKILGIFFDIVRIGFRTFCCTDSCFYFVLTGVLLLCIRHQFNAMKVKT